MPKKDCVPGHFRNMRELKAASKAAGEDWFTPAALEYFNGTVYDTLYGGCLFITSERPPIDSRTGYQGKREYTVRVALRDGTIESVSEFRQYANKARAESVAVAVAKIMLEYAGECPSQYHREGEFKEEIEKFLNSYAN